jgi:hypothetical protein
VAVTAVRAGPGGVAIARPPAGWPSIGTTDVVGAVAASAAAWGFVPRDIDVAVIVGVAATMAGLPEGITAATGLTSVVDREPLAAAACGAALLVREPATRLGAALAIGVPAVGAAMLAAPEDGAAVGGGVAAAAGEALSGEAEGGGVAAAAGTALSGTKIHPAKRPPKHRPRALRPKAALLLAPVVVTLGLGTVALRSCAGDAGTPDLVTSAAPAEPGDPPRSTTTIGPRQGSDGAGVPKGTPGQAVPASEPPTSTTSRPRSTTTAPPATPAPPTPATPAPPPPDVPPSVTNLARTVESIGADASDSPFGGGCQIPQTTKLSATVTDASGLASVRVTWSTTWGHSGTIDMARGAGDVWTATLGPIKDAQRFTDESTPVTWSVEAVDTAGHSQTVTAGPDAGVTLHGCVIVLT